MPPDQRVPRSQPRPPNGRGARQRTIPPWWPVDHFRSASLSFARKLPWRPRAGSRWPSGSRMAKMRVINNSVEKSPRKEAEMICGFRRDRKSVFHRNHWTITCRMACREADHHSAGSLDCKKQPPINNPFAVDQKTIPHSRVSRHSRLELINYRFDFLT